MRYGHHSATCWFVLFIYKDAVDVQRGSLLSVMNSPFVDGLVYGGVHKSLVKVNDQRELPFFDKSFRSLPFQSLGNLQRPQFKTKLSCSIKHYIY